MSGNGILTNGKGTRRQYGGFNLDELEARLIEQLNILINFKINILIDVNSTYC